MAESKSGSSSFNWWEQAVYWTLVLLLIPLMGLVAVVTYWRIDDLMSNDGEPTIAYYIAIDAPVEDSVSGGESDGESGDQSGAAPTPNWAELSPEQIEAFRTEEMEIALYKVEVARQDAQDAVDSAQLVLSFLEGAGLLIALAAGLAAIYGLRSSREVRTELRQEKDDLQQSIQTQIEQVKGLEGDIRQQQSDGRKNLDRMQQVLEGHQNDLNALPDRLAQVVTLERDLKHSPTLFRYLLQTYQEYQVGNHTPAYEAVQQALELDPQNPIALYYAGWLELQYIPNRIDEGIDHFQQLYQVDPGWVSAVAAYGVVLRRKATRLSGADRENLFFQAEGHLLTALGISSHLLDLNRESLWGPVGGIQQDRERDKPASERDFNAAIETYEKAVNVTPGSSYPHGNLAALYMWRLKQNPDNAEYETRTVRMFEQTATLAQAELAVDPSDYYHVMDIAMAKTVLSQQRPDRHVWDDAADMTQKALRMNPTASMLEVSLRGWTRLLEYCPDHWHDLREKLQDARDQFAEAFDAAIATSSVSD